MFKRILVGALLTLGLAFGGLSATEAHAEVTSGSTTSYSEVNVTDEMIVTDVASGDVVGKVNLEFIVKGGITYKGKCPTVSKVTSKLLKTKKCFYLKAGKKFVNSGRNHDGKVVYFTDTTKSKTKFVKKGSSWHKASCGNYVRFKKYPSLKSTAVALVESFAEVTVKVKAIAKASVKATAEAWCKSNSSSASGSASATGSAEASVEASASAKTEFEAKIKATGSIDVAKLRNQVEADAKAEAKAKATAQAEAKAVCTEAPPVTPAPNILEVTTVNDFRTGQEGFITASGTVASGHTATLFASAKNGGTITANKSQTVSGNFTVNVTYKASTEVGTDQVEFTLTQDDGQKATKSTNVFNILERQTTP